MPKESFILRHLKNILSYTPFAPDANAWSGVDEKYGIYIAGISSLLSFPKEAMDLMEHTQPECYRLDQSC